MASIACMTPITGRRSGSVHRVEKRTSLRGRSRSTRTMSDTGMLAISESMAYLQISGSVGVPIESEANNTGMDAPSVVEIPAPSTSQQPTISKLTYQGRVLWTQTTIATVSASLERLGLTPGMDESIIGSPIPGPPCSAPSTPSSSAPSTPPYGAPGSGTSTPATTPPSRAGPSPRPSPPTSPGPPPNSPRRRLSINMRYRVPGTQMTVYHRRGKMHIVGSGRTPWIRKEATVRG